MFGALHQRIMVVVATISLSIGLCGCATKQPAPTGSVAQKCRLCNKEIPKGGGVEAKVADSLDVRSYRCIHCALTDLAAETKDVTLTARSPSSGQLIQLRRQKTAWTADPSTAVYLILPEHANECLDVHQPFISQAEFERYVSEHPEIAAQRPEPYTIAQYAQILEAGKPRR